MAARRLDTARPAVAALAEEHAMPAENLLTPDHLRRVLWTPPATRDPEALAQQLDERLADLGSRQWQRSLTVPLLVEAVIAADTEPPQPDPGDPGDAGDPGEGRDQQS